jgi:hypothetical protein
MTEVASIPPGTADPRAALSERELEAATRTTVLIQPFDVLAEGLLIENSWGDWI